MRNKKVLYPYGTRTGGRKVNNNKTSKLTFMGVMLALTIVFVLVTALPNISFSMAVVMFIPTILTGIVYGPLSGAIMGGCAGLATLLRALLMPLVPTDAFFINPLVSIVPRIFIGIAAAYTFFLLNKKLKVSSIISSAIAAGIATLVNTLLVVGALYLVFGQTMVDTMGMGFMAALVVLFTSNGIVEVIASVIIVPIIYSAYLRYAKMK